MIDEDASQWDEMQELFLLSEYLDASNLEASFEEYLSDRRRTHDEIAYYDDHGSWRSTDAIPGHEVDEPLEVQPNQCYYNCQTRIGPDLNYVEGYAVNTDGRQAVPHAWLERDDGTIIEPTPTIAPAVTRYYGVRFNNVDVTEAMIRREQADPIVEAVLNGLITDADE